MSDGKCIVKYLRLSLEDEDMLDESIVLPIREL